MTQIHELTAAETAAAIRDRNLSATEVMEALLARAERMEPELCMWATLDPEYALSQARALDQMLAAGGSPGPLCGVATGIKDIYDTSGLPTSFGSPMFAGNVPDADAAAVSFLKDAGGVVMGKTVTTAMACGDPPETRNPWRTDRTPGGSSTGSAVGVAARVFPLALGSQTAGSVLRPAAYNGVVGLKPSMGRISRRGVLPVSWSVDTMGVFSTNAEDAALALSALSRHDPKDPYNLDAPPPIWRGPADRAPSIGLLRTFFLEECDPAVASHVEGIAATLESEGATVTELECDFDFGAIQAAHRTVMNVGAAAVHQHTYRERPGDFAPDVRRAIEIGTLTSSTTYIQAERIRRTFREALVATIAPFDAVLTAVTREAGAPGIDSTGDPLWQAPITSAGLPAISLPTGLTPLGLPLGVQLVAGPMEDELLLSIAAWTERAIGFAAMPTLGRAQGT